MNDYSQSNDYFEWLLLKAGVSDDDRGYSALCSIMYDTMFYPIVKMDENRWEDGMRYRADYSEDDYEVDQLDQLLCGCTVLELILSMAEKMAYEMAESVYEAGAGKWFEELIGNLGLDIYTNQELIGNEAAYFEVDAILTRFVFRRYNYNGEGGLFPLRYADEDQRTVELAIQMNQYIAENYDIL